MTETSGPPKRVGTVADLRTRQSDRAAETLARLEAEQIQQATDFGQRYGTALLDGLRSTRSAFLAERNQTAAQVRADAETIRRQSQQMAQAARGSARMWWLPTLSVCVLLIVGSLLFAWWQVTTATRTPAAAETATIKGQKFEVLTGPNWTTCTYDGRLRPCRPVKD
jgi:hypothetical protein